MVVAPSCCFCNPASAGFLWLRAGERNRTAISTLAMSCNSHYTTPALPSIVNFLEKRSIQVSIFTFCSRLLTTTMHIPHDNLFVGWRLRMYCVFIKLFSGKRTISFQNLLHCSSDKSGYKIRPILIFSKCILRFFIKNIMYNPIILGSVFEILKGFFSLLSPSPQYSITPEVNNESFCNLEKSFRARPRIFSRHLSHASLLSLLISRNLLHAI